MRGQFRALGPLTKSRQLPVSLKALIVILVAVFITTIVLVSVYATRPIPTEWTSWSGWCYETGPQTYRQIRRRPIGSTKEEVQQRECITQSCYVFQWNTMHNISCVYNATTNECETSSWALQSAYYCATNATNWTDYLASQTPFNVATSERESPLCIPECPLTNASNPAPTPTPTPIPTPTPSPAMCNYSVWSDWSASCMETSDGVYQQMRVRYASRASVALLGCHGESESRDCEPSSCFSSTYYSVDETTCVYGADSQCISSSNVRTIALICATDATDLTAYMNATSIKVVQADFLAANTCGSECPQFNPDAPTPSPTPTPTPIPTPTPTSVPVENPWSMTCDDVAEESITYARWRLAADGTGWEYQNCAGGLEENATWPCQRATVGAVETNTCFYDADGLCEAATSNTYYPIYCTTNATDWEHYRTWAPFIVETQNISFPACDDVLLCVENPTGPPLTTITEEIDLPPDVNITTGVTCDPPYYFDSTTLACEECANSSLCTLGYIDYVTGTCTQINKCDDGNLCTVDGCSATGVCGIMPSAQNTLNLFTQQVCDYLDGVVTAIDLVNTAIVPNPGACEDTFDLYAFFDTTTSNCTYIPKQRPVVPPFNASSCYTRVQSSGQTFLTSMESAAYWVCGIGGTQICYDGTCRTLESLRGDHCDFKVTNYDELGRSSTHTFLNSTLCPASSITGRPYRVCTPQWCPHSVTHCGYSDDPETQQSITALDMLSISCCSTDDDCEEGYGCWSLQCVPVAV